jgi:uncharacterized membrane protein
MSNSEARGISESNQVGYSWTSTGIFVTEAHAILWTGTVASAIDLNPPGFALSEAHATSGPDQVGSGSLLPGFAAEYHALLWHGTAASYIDLNPPGFVLSSAYGVSGNTQVGSGLPIAGVHTYALAWNDSSASVVNLHPFVASLNPAFTDSFAVGVSINGTISGYAYDAAGHSAAILWTPVPEPMSYALLAGSSICTYPVFLRLRRRGRTLV